MSEITLQARQEASERLAVKLDETARQLSAYGIIGCVAFDEEMVYSGVAHALATWMSEANEEQLRERLRLVVLATIAAWQNGQAIRHAH